MRKTILTFIKSNNGVTAVEYAVVAVAVAATVSTVFLEPTLANAISAAFTKISTLILAI